MATIHPFPLRATGDWTTEERARLDELAARFAGQADIEIVYGKSDRGDPWCVVLDAGDEVLVHVARERGSFVVHAAADDLFFKATDLRSAVERVLGSRWLDERAEVIVPFTGARAIQVVTAVLVVSSFVEHHRTEARPLEDWVVGLVTTQRPTRDAARDEAPTVALAAAEHDGVDLPPMPLPAVLGGTALPAVPPARPTNDPVVEVRSPGEALAAELIEASQKVVTLVVVGTNGDDRLENAVGSGAPLLLDGGAGNDEIHLEDQTLAIGGDGADRFVLSSPALAGELPRLGIIADFDPSADRLVTGDDLPVSVLGSQPVADVLAELKAVVPGLAPLPSLPGAQLVVDLDHDGRGDGVVLINAALPAAGLLNDIRAAFGADAASPPSLAIAPVADPLMIAPSADVI